MNRCTRMNHKLSFVWVDGRGRCYFPIHLRFETRSFVLQVGSANYAELFGTLPTCFSWIIFFPQRAVWISVFKRRRVVIAMMCVCPPRKTHRNCTIRSRMLMNLSAVFGYLSSRCAVGDVLPFFFWMDRLTSVGPTVCSGTSTSCDTQPNVVHC